MYEDLKRVIGVKCPQGFSAHGMDCYCCGEHTNLLPDTINTEDMYVHAVFCDECSVKLRESKSERDNLWEKYLKSKERWGKNVCS